MTARMGSDTKFSLHERLGINVRLSYRISLSMDGVKDIYFIVVRLGGGLPGYVHFPLRYLTDVR